MRAFHTALCSRCDSYRDPLVVLSIGSVSGSLGRDMSLIASFVVALSLWSCAMLRYCCMVCHAAVVCHLI